MSTETKPNPVLRELESYGDELLPGAAATLAQRWGDLARYPAGQLAAEVAKRLDPTKGIARQFLNPGFQQTALTPLAQVLARKVNDKLITPEAAEQLRVKWSADLAGAPADRVASEVVRRLGAFENRQYLTVPPALPGDVARLADVLATHFPEIPFHYREQLAVDRRQLANVSYTHGAESQMVRAIAGELRVQVSATRYGLNAPLASDDPRVDGLPPQRTEAADGTGSSNTPAVPAPRTNSL